MSKTTLAVPAPLRFTPPAFVGQIMEAVRAHTKDDGVIRVRMDSSAKTVVAFTAQWHENRNRNIDRRVYVETKLNDDGNYSLVYMTKLFDENAVNYVYLPRSFDSIAKDILHFLRTGVMPEALAEA